MTQLEVSGAIKLQADVQGEVQQLHVHYDISTACVNSNLLKLASREHAQLISPQSSNWARSASKHKILSHTWCLKGRTILQPVQLVQAAPASPARQHAGHTSQPLLVHNLTRAIEVTFKRAQGKPCTTLTSWSSWLDSGTVPGDQAAKYVSPLS